MPLILAVNAGSSSLKSSIYRRGTLELVATSSASLKTEQERSKVIINDSPPTYEAEIRDHASALAHFLHNVKLDDEVVNVCHRVVHGGDYQQPIVITKDSYEHIEALSALAPLHNKAALTVMDAALKLLPNAQSIAFFDTTFHRTIPPHISTYAIDPTIARKKGLKKYGFHGLSYAYILRQVSTYLQKRPEDLSLIILHLGSGASICAVQNGRSLDTSMEFTPLSGLPGATRSGSVDPSLIFHYSSKVDGVKKDDKGTLGSGLHVTEAEEILNKQAGWNALAGTKDFARVTREAAEGNEQCALAFRLFVDRILNYIGAYHLKLHGSVDAVVFAGGIGENSAGLRKTIGEHIRCLGFPDVDGQRNERAGKSSEVVIDISNDTKRVLVCHTDEQQEMAKQCEGNVEFWQRD
ncbi:acetate kinase [Pluteus cervinus]|uniref:Acetate kinase n=1 Tax=Pluteus cervinus TaxID=181527 RepID=A0ACD3BBC2_9AGAR|nr:acetate kinase [Pluteus cervinus]